MNCHLHRTSIDRAFLIALTLSLHAETAAATTGVHAETAAETSAAEPPPERKLALTTSLVTPFFGAYLLEGTARVSESFGLLANASYLSLKNPEDDAWKCYSGTVGAGLDFYFPHQALRRVYFEAIGELVFSSWHHQPSGQVAPISIGYTVVALVGYRYIFRVGPVLDVGAGVVAIHFPSASVELDDGGSASSEAFTHIYPAIKLNVGWAF